MARSKRFLELHPNRGWECKKCGNRRKWKTETLADGTKARLMTEKGYVRHAGKRKCRKCGWSASK